MLLQNINKERIITGLGLIFVVIIIAWIDNFFLTWLFLGVVFMFAFYEAMRLFGVRENALYFYAAALWIVSYFYPNPDDLIFIALIVFASVMVYRSKVDFRLTYAFIYPASSFLFLLALYKDFSIEALVWLVIIVAGTDIGAYFTGKAIGKTKFCAASPNKTWEGVIGGVAAAGILGSFYGTQFVTPFLSVVISLLVSFSSIFGDLF